MAIYIKRVGTDHPAVAQFKEKAARLSYRKGDATAARATFAAALSTLEERFGGDHIEKFLLFR